jgi:hypothetical protein
MAPAVFFLLLAIWMQELSLIGIRPAAAVGVALLAGVAYELERYRRLAQAGPSTAAALAALGRVAKGRRRPAPRAVRPILR